MLKALSFLSRSQKSQYAYSCYSSAICGILSYLLLNLFTSSKILVTFGNPCLKNYGYCTATFMYNERIL